MACFSLVDFINLGNSITQAHFILDITELKCDFLPLLLVLAAGVGLKSLKSLYLGNLLDFMLLLFIDKAFKVSLFPSFDNCCGWESEMPEYLRTYLATLLATVKTVLIMNKSISIYTILDNSNHHKPNYETKSNLIKTIFHLDQLTDNAQYWQHKVDWLWKIQENQSYWNFDSTAC